MTDIVGKRISPFDIGQVTGLVTEISRSLPQLLQSNVWTISTSAALDILVY